MFRRRSAAPAMRPTAAPTRRERCFVCKKKKRRTPSWPQQRRHPRLFTGDGISRTHPDAAQPLPDVRFVYRKNKSPLSYPEQASRPARFGTRNRLAACMQKRQENRTYPAENRLDCGKGPAYPQDRMCRTAGFLTAGFFVQHWFSIDTMLVQPIRERVNR